MALSPLRVRGHVSGMVAAVIIDQRPDAGVFECTDGGNHMFCGCWKKGGSGNGRGLVGGRGGGGHRMLGVPCYAALGPPGDDRVMRAHVLEGRGRRVDWAGWTDTGNGAGEWCSVGDRGRDEGECLQDGGGSKVVPVFLFKGMRGV